MTIGKPTIAIIGGTGKEGTGLALRWARAGYQVIIGSRQAEKAVLAAQAINHQLEVDSTLGLENAQAAERAQICVLTVITAAHDQTVEYLKPKLMGKIVVDATSRVDYLDPQPPKPPSAAQRAQDILGSGTKVVAAFQNVPANVLKRAIDEPLEADVLVCSDDQEAAEKVVELAYAAGLSGYYAGKLANAIVVEGLTSILISMNKYYKRKNASVKITGIAQ
jgi:hypothetical protein